jgi:hypothetical protein
MRLWVLSTAVWLQALSRSAASTEKSGSDLPSIRKAVPHTQHDSPAFEPPWEEEGTTGKLVVEAVQRPLFKVEEQNSVQTLSVVIGD